MLFAYILKVKIEPEYWKNSLDEMAWINFASHNNCCPSIHSDFRACHYFAEVSTFPCRSFKVRGFKDIYLHGSLVL